MTVEELKAKLPEAEVYRFDPNARYLIVVNSSRVSAYAMTVISQELSKQNIHGTIVIVQGDPAEAVRILEMKGETQ